LISCLFDELFSRCFRRPISKSGKTLQSNDKFFTLQNILQEIFKKKTFQPFYINEKEEDWMIAAEYTDHSSA
jgi:hypothetical protein